MAYYKPQSPIKSGENYIYPITTIDQIILNDGSRLNDKCVTITTADEETAEGIATINADFLGGAPAEDYALWRDIRENYATKEENAEYISNSVVFDSTKLNGKNPSYYLTQHNILDNSNFADLVATAGLNAEHADGNTYIGDRWFINGDLSCELNKYNYCILTNANGGESINQKIIGLVGKTVTFAVKIESDNEILLSIDNFTTGTNITNQNFTQISQEIYTITATIPADATIVNFKYYPNYNSGGSSKIYWAAVYEGEYTPETLPPYMPKGRAAEELECSRYCFSLGTKQWQVATHTASYVVSNITLPIIMNSAPTLNNVPWRIYLGSWLEIPAPAVNMQGHIIRFTFRPVDWPESSAATDRNYFWTTDDNLLLLCADL